MARPLISFVLLTMLLAVPALAVDLDDVIRMLEADVDEEVILRVVDSEQTRFYLSAEDIIDLRYAGASDWFLDEMLDRSIDEPRRSRSTTYVADPYAVYYSIGIAYDPFDYYFVTWPYYYAYVSPFRFYWTWWYYGGPYHVQWHDPWGWRTQYYDSAWGVRTIWSRGYNDRVYRVPRYSASAKQMRQAVYRQRVERTGGKTARYERKRHRSLSSRTTHGRRTISRTSEARKARYERSRTLRRPDRTAIGDRRVRSEKPARRSPTWGRSERGSRRSSGARPSRPSIGSQKPSRSRSPSVGRTTRSSGSHRANPPARPSRGARRSR